LLPCQRCLSTFSSNYRQSQIDRYSWDRHTQFYARSYICVYLVACIYFLQISIYVVAIDSKMMWLVDRIKLAVRLSHRWLVKMMETVNPTWVVVMIWGEDASCFQFFFGDIGWSERITGDVVHWLSEKPRTWFLWSVWKEFRDAISSPLKPNSFKSSKDNTFYFCYFSPPNELNNDAQQHYRKDEEKYLGISF
jgi:hypothetical protein